MSRLSLADPIFERQITVAQAYRLLEAFLVQYNARGESTTVALISDIGLLADGTSADPAQLEDFLRTCSQLLGEDLGASVYTRAGPADP